jgi:class 3 adenylate cyclase
VTSPGTTTREAERRQLTLPFCDLVCSTELAAQLDPEDLRAVMGAYRAACAVVLAVRRPSRQVPRRRGVSLLRVACSTRGRRRACRAAALQLVEVVGRLAPRAEVRLQARVGVATGHVVVGDEDASDSDSVSGETPNLGGPSTDAG